MASVAIVIHKASTARSLQDLEILRPEIGNLPCIDLPECGAPAQAASDGLAQMVGQAAVFVMAVNATLLCAPFAHLSAECAGILDVLTVSRHCTDAELTKLQTLVALSLASVTIRLIRSSHRRMQSWQASIHLR